MQDWQSFGVDDGGIEEGEMLAEVGKRLCLIVVFVTARFGQINRPFGSAATRAPSAKRAQVNREPHMAGVVSKRAFQCSEITSKTRNGR